jgi:hypothetical protein
MFLSGIKMNDVKRKEKEGIEGAIYRSPTP